MIPSDQTPLAVPKVASLVAQRLRKQILRGELREGDTLPPEAELVGYYQVSRQTLREAFRLLEAESLIETRRGRSGAVVRRPAGELVAQHAGIVLQMEGATLSDVMRCRLDLEPSCARLLAENRSPVILESLAVALAAEKEQMNAMPGENSAGVHFHAEVVRLAGSPTLSLFALIIENITDRSNEHIRRDPAVAARQKRSAHRAHVKLVSLIRDGAADESGNLWREHLVKRNKEWLDLVGGHRIVDITADR